MHKLIDYLCDELEELERKADKDGKLSMQEIQYGDTLAHFKKNLLKAEEMTDDDYSHDMGSYRGYDRTYDPMMRRSYARNQKRDSMGRYSRTGEDFKYELRELMDDAPNDHIRQKIQNLMSEM